MSLGSDIKIVLLPDVPINAITRQGHVVVVSPVEKFPFFLLLFRFLDGHLRLTTLLDRMWGRRISTQTGVKKGPKSPRVHEADDIAFVPNVAILRLYNFPMRRTQARKGRGLVRRRSTVVRAIYSARLRSGPLQARCSRKPAC